MKTALLLIDLQNDFCPGGSLGVQEGDQVVAPLNALARSVRAAGGMVIHTGDFHPPQTSHFDTWPVHCLVDTPGSDLHAALDVQPADLLIRKGTDANDDAYSGFDGALGEPDAVPTGAAGERPSGTVGPYGATAVAAAAVESGAPGLDEWLREQGVDAITVVGIATDHCVRATVLDALDAGYEVTVLTDLVAGVDEAAAQAALHEMEAAGAILATS